MSLRHRFAFQRGDSVKGFYLLLSGEMEAVEGDTVLGTIRAGDYVGEISLLEWRDTWDVSVRCKTACELLEVSKADFEASLAASASANTMLHRVFAFVQAVSPSSCRTNLKRGEPMFRQGDAVEPAFYILNSGLLQVAQKQRSKGELQLGEIKEGGCFGEHLLLPAAS